MIPDTLPSLSNTLSAKLELGFLSTLTPTIVWIVVLVGIGIALLGTLILVWHWKKYNVGQETRTHRISIVYGIIMGMAIMGMVIGAILYQISYNLSI